MAVSAVAGAADDFGAVDVAGALLRGVGNVQLSAGDGDVDAVLKDGMVAGVADDFALEAQVVLGEVRIAADFGQLDGETGHSVDGGDALRLGGDMKAGGATAFGAVDDDGANQIQLACAGASKQTNFSHGFSTS